MMFGIYFDTTTCNCLLFQSNTMLSDRQLSCQVQNSNSDPEYFRELAGWWLWKPQAIRPIYLKQEDNVLKSQYQPALLAVTTLSGEETP